MRRFVILEHDHPYLHWDLMLEEESSLRTWRLENPPTTDVLIQATPLASHRLIYLEYEGPVSGDRGIVRRWDQGSYQLISHDETHWLFEMLGQRSRGRACLELRADHWIFLLQAITNGDGLNV